MNTSLLIVLCTMVSVPIIGAVIYERRKREDQLRRYKAVKSKTARSFTQYPDCVYDLQEAASMFLQIQRDMGNIFGFTLDTPISVQFSYPDQLSRELYGMPVNWHPIGMCKLENGEIVVYVEWGMPRPCFYATLAHEYVHVWQRLGLFLHGRLEKVEGFAEWVSFILTERAGYDTTMIFDRPSWDPYGIGFRKFRTLQNKYGIRKTVELAKSKKLNLHVLRGNY